MLKATIGSVKYVVATVIEKVCPSSIMMDEVAAMVDLHVALSKLRSCFGAYSELCWSTRNENRRRASINGAHFQSITLNRVSSLCVLKTHHSESVYSRLSHIYCCLPVISFTMLENHSISTVRHNKLVARQLSVEPYCSCWHKCTLRLRELQTCCAAPKGRMEWSNAAQSSPHIKYMVSEGGKYYEEMSIVNTLSRTEQRISANMNPQMLISLFVTRNWELR